MRLTQQEVALIGAKKKRELALKNYYEEPNYCLECKSLIQVKDNEKVHEVKRKKFCSRSCGASYNGRKYPKRHALTQGACEKCGTIIDYRKQKNGNYTRRRFCDSCLSDVRHETTHRYSKYCLICDTPLGGKRKYCDACLPDVLSSSAKKGVHESSVADYTIERLKKRSNGYWSWRVAITKHARTSYIRAGLAQKCLICGYDKHFDVCHKKDVSGFSEETTVKEINSLDNLVALCKNHHWEFDHGLLSKRDKNKIEGA